MIPLKSRNSGLNSNCCAVKGGGCVSLGPVSWVFRSSMCYLPILSGEMFVGKPPSDNMPHGKHKALNIGHVPIVVAKGLLVNVTKQVERLDGDVGSVQAPFQETPEVLQAIRVNIAANILNGVVHSLMLKVVKAIVRLQFVGVQGRTGFYVLTDKFLKFGSAVSVRHVARGLARERFRHVPGPPPQ